ncbi:MAG: DNA-3-methyladenine glycosylase 2 family protein [Gemmatimonadaceae bacterium]|nr:DNA-3-methyladenine glycosylase 2 family protein [Gemmatimonadaceae bacterium]
MNHTAAIRHLKRADPVLGAIIRSVGTCELGTSRQRSHFRALTRSIIYQQLSGKAAATILSRMHAIYGGRAPTAEQLLATPDAALQAAGVSRQKISYLRDLATRVHEGSVPLTRIARLPDEELITTITQVKGIGRWTAQMFLMFQLHRPDVLPELDLGIQNAIWKAYGLRKRPLPQDVLRIGKPWRPHASVASWYLWRSLDTA